MAMALEGVGPAIAAGTRLTKNKEYAEKLALLPAVSLNTLLDEALNIERIPPNTHFTTFAMLYGSDDVQLKLLVEWLPAHNVNNANIKNAVNIESDFTAVKPNRIIYLSKQKPAENWLAANVLTEKIASAYPHIIKTMADYSEKIEVHELPQERAIPQQGEGAPADFVLEEMEDFTVALSYQYPATVWVREK